MQIFSSYERTDVVFSIDVITTVCAKFYIFSHTHRHFIRKNRVKIFSKTVSEMNDAISLFACHRCGVSFYLRKRICTLVKRLTNHKVIATFNCASCSQAHTICTSKLFNIESAMDSIAATNASDFLAKDSC